MKTNEIRREIALKADRERVWWALTTHEGWTGWFSQEVRGTFASGETLELVFGGVHVCEAQIVEFDPMDAMAYQWHPGDAHRLADHPVEHLTTVRFTLADAPEGTLLTMVESGFERIPDPRHTEALRENNGGWDSELPKIQPLVESGICQETANVS